MPLPLIASSATTVPSIKRRRTDTPDETSADSASSLPSRKPRDGPKKKKANRACYHCQKAHLTCDDCELYPLLPIEGWCFFSDTTISPTSRQPARPCQRCVKRGFANNCTEGHRKKAKYLLDDDELGVSTFIDLACKVDKFNHVFRQNS